MAKVTDINYYMDDRLKSNLDYMIERELKKWDNLIIIDGDPGTGKSIFGMQIAYYLAHTQKKEFTAQNEFFDIEDLMDYFVKNRNKILVWDESASEGMGVDWQNENQKKLIKLLFMARKFGHMLIFIIPEVRKLQSVFAGSRSICLLRVFSPDNLHRGFFKFYNQKRKRTVYDNERKQNFVEVAPNFEGRFANPNAYTPLIDMDIYEDKKDKAINKITEETEKAQKKDHLKTSQERFVKMVQLARSLGLTYKEIKDRTGIELQTIKEMVSKYDKKKDDIPIV